MASSKLRVRLRLICQNVIHVELYIKRMFHMITRVCITSQYHTITHPDARFDPKYILVNML